MTTDRLPATIHSMGKHISTYTKTSPGKLFAASFYILCFSILVISCANDKILFVLDPVYAEFIEENKQEVRKAVREFGYTVSFTVYSDQVESNQVESNQVESNQVESNQVESNQVDNASILNAAGKSGELSANQRILDALSGIDDPRDLVLLSPRVSSLYVSDSPVIDPVLEAIRQLPQRQVIVWIPSRHVQEEASSDLPSGNGSPEDYTRFSGGFIRIERDMTPAWQAAGEYAAGTAENLGFIYIDGDSEGEAYAAAFQAAAAWQNADAAVQVFTLSQDGSSAENREIIQGARESKTEVVGIYAGARTPDILQSAVNNRITVITEEADWLAGSKRELVVSIREDYAGTAKKLLDQIAFRQLKEADEPVLTVPAVWELVFGTGTGAGTGAEGE